MNTKALRQKILDLAIHGKLVPQDPNDEPASVLLERIRAEKERLIKEGKIKRPKKTKATSDKPHYENVPFEIPDNWVWTTLGEIFTLQAGKNITAKDIYTEKSEEFKYPCFGGNGIRGYVAISNKIGEYPIIGRQGALCGNINLAHGIFYATEHAVVVERYCDTDLMWGYYTLIALNLNQYATATAQPGLAVNVINDVAIPLPPLHEQQRISKSIKILFSFLDAIECKKLYLKTAISQTKTKVLDLAIHGRLVPQDPTDEPATELLKRINPKAEITSDNGHYQKLPEGWCMTNIGSLFDAVSAKRVLKSEWKDKGVPFYRAREIVQLNKEGFADKDLFISEEHFSEIKDKYGIPAYGDIMISAVGSIGYTYIVKENDVFYYKDASVLCLKNTRHWNSKFFSIWLASPFLQKQMYKNSKGTTVDTITLEKLKGYVIPFPPLNEQHRIVAKVEEIFAQLDTIEASL